MMAIVPLEGEIVTCNRCQQGNLGWATSQRTGKNFLAAVFQQNGVYVVDTKQFHKCPMQGAPTPVAQQPQPVPVQTQLGQPATIPKQIEKSFGEIVRNHAVCLHWAQRSFELAKAKTVNAQALNAAAATIMIQCKEYGVKIPSFEETFMRPKPPQQKAHPDEDALLDEPPDFPDAPPRGTPAADDPEGFPSDDEIPF